MQSDDLTSPGEWAFALLFAGVALLIRAAYLRVQSRMTRAWKPITAVVTHSQIEEREYSSDGESVIEYRPDVIYVYTVAGKDHAVLIRETRNIAFRDAVLGLAALLGAILLSRLKL